MFSSWHRHPSLTFNWAGGLIAARPVIFAACAHNDARVCQQCKNNSNNNYCSPHIHPSLFNESISRSRTDLLLKMAFFYSHIRHYYPGCPGILYRRYWLVPSWESHPRQDLCRPPPLLAAKAGRKYHYPLSMSLRCTPPQGAFSGLYSLDTIFCGFSGHYRSPWLSSRIPFALAGLALPLVTAGRERSV